MILSLDSQTVPVSFSVVSFKRENMSIVPGQVLYRVFREICVKLNIHDNKFLKQGKHIRSLFKTAGADKTCPLHYCLVVFNIVDFTNDISPLKIAS